MIRFLILLFYAPIRFLEISSVLGYALIYYALNIRNVRRDNRVLGVYYQKIFETLGGTFIKAGQALSLRFDILPIEHCEALSGLLDQVKPFNSSKGHRMIEKDLGASVTELFASISDDPVASASFSQVYKAVAHDGTVLAVKVKRPGMNVRVAADTFFLQCIRMFVILTGVGYRMGASQMISEVCEILKNELDYDRESRFLYLMNMSARKIPSLVVPTYHPKLSGKRVLTMDFLEGPTFRDLMTAKRQGRLHEMRDSEGNPIPVGEACNNLFQITFRSIYELGFFHADPHAGNVVVLPGGKVGLIDFGIVGVLEKDMRRRNLDYLNALVRGDAAEAAEIYADMLTQSARSDREALIRDTSLELMVYLSKTNDPKLPISERSSASLYLRSIYFARKHGFALPRNVMLYYKTVFTMDNMLIAVHPSYDSREQTMVYLSGYMSRKMQQEMGFEQFMLRSTKMLDLMSRMPESVDDLFELVGTQSARAKKQHSAADAILSSIYRAASVILLIGTVALPLAKYVAFPQMLKGIDLGGTVIICAAMALVGLRMRA